MGTGPSGIRCKDYVATRNGECRHLLTSGCCALPERLVCIEQQKPVRTPELAPTSSQFRLGIPSAPAPAEPRPLAPGFQRQDIDSFKALGVEVCLASDDFGEIWLVPNYTGAARREITPEHAATLLHVLTVFPGARVIAFHKPAKAEQSSSQENSK